MNETFLEKEFNRRKDRPELYEDVPLEEWIALVKLLQADRDCWISNCNGIQKYYNKAQDEFMKMLKERESSHS